MEQDSHWRVSSRPVLALAFSGVQCTGRWPKVRAAPGFVWLWLAQARHQSPLLGRQVHHRLLESEGRYEDVDQDDDEIYSVAGEQKPYANCLR